MPEICNAPSYLRAEIALVAQRQYRMVVGLRDGAAVPTMPFAAQLVCRDDARVSFRLSRLEPSHQGGPQVKAQIRVVVYDVLDLAFAIDDSGKCIGTVT